KPAGHTDLEIYVSIVRFGRSLPIRAHPTLNAQLSMRDKAHSELDVGRWALVKRSEHLSVSNPPPKPLMIWDGECHFCKRWIERWREITDGKVDYVTYQEAAARFPEIPIEQFQRAVAFIGPDGEVFFAAEAVYRSLGYRSSRKWLAWSYNHAPGFAGISDAAYKFIARYRSLGSIFTRLLWGKDVRPPTYFWARRWFLR